MTFLIRGVIVSGIGIARAPKPLGLNVIVEKLLSWYVFFSVGVCYLYNAIVHIFFGRMAAAFIGWADSPFQFQVGTASLGFAVVGFLAAFHSFYLRLRAVIPCSIFTLRAATRHVRQPVTA